MTKKLLSIFLFCILCLSKINGVIFEVKDLSKLEEEVCTLDSNSLVLFDVEFDSMQLIDNLTATIDVPSTPFNEPYAFHQIGMIYRVNSCRLLKDEQQGDLQHPKNNAQNYCGNGG